MQLTPNYNLKKPEGTDPVDIQDFNDNADILDAELNKKADSAGGDISNMTIKALEEPAGTQFPVPEAGETSKSFLGKIRKFMNDFKSWNTGVCMIGQIVNNCVTNNDKLPLSAAQGKVLMDLYSVLNTNFTRLDSDLGDLNGKVAIINEDQSDAMEWAKRKYESLPNVSIKILYNSNGREALYIFCKSSEYFGMVLCLIRVTDAIQWQKLRITNKVWDATWIV